MKEYDPAVLALKERLPDPAEIRYVNVEVLHPSGASQLEFANLRPAPRDVDPATIAELVAGDRAVIADALGDEVAAARGDLYANVVLGSLVHDISLVRALVGQIKTVDDVNLWAEQDAPGSIEIAGTIDENARVHLHWHYLADYPHYRETVTIHHTTGTLELEFTVPYLLNAPTELRIVTKSGTGNSHELVRSVDEAFEAELVAFHRMVTEGVEPPTRAEHGRAWMCRPGSASVGAARPTARWPQPSTRSASPPYASCESALRAPNRAHRAKSASAGPNRTFRTSERERSAN